MGRPRGQFGVFDDVAVKKALAQLDAIRIADKLSLPLKVSAMSTSTKQARAAMATAVCMCWGGWGRGNRLEPDSGKEAAVTVPLPRQGNGPPPPHLGHHHLHHGGTTPLRVTSPHSVSLHSTPLHFTPPHSTHYTLLHFKHHLLHWVD